MRKQLKLMAVTVLMTAAMTAAMASTAFAAGWQQNDTGWWYGTNDANTEWYADGWQWIDGNGDGTAECYYFDGNGYMLADTTTPDGFQVGADGAWVENGNMQTKAVEVPDNQEYDTSDLKKYNHNGVGMVAIDMLNHTKAENARYGETYVENTGNGEWTHVRYANGLKATYFQNTELFGELAYEIVAGGDNATSIFRDAVGFDEDSLAESLKKKGYYAYSLDDVVVVKLDDDRMQIDISCDDGHVSSASVCNYTVY